MDVACTAAFGLRRSRLMAAASTLSLAVGAGLTAAPPAAALVTNNNTTPAAAVDTTNTRPYWVGLAIRNEAGNSGGSCTGLLINPRTVLFAAHCVDGVAPAGYDAPTAPGNRAQVGYTTDPVFGRANLRNWLFSLDFGIQPGSDGRTMASSVMVWYDPRSRNGSAPIPNNGAFLPADVAIAAFDTPNELLGRDAAGGIGLLFTPIAGAVPVTIGGYGTSGDGQTGVRTSTTAPESYFRRLGQNIVSFLGDERTIAAGIYPLATADILAPATRVYQDLYWADFDDPNRATRPFFNGPGADPLCAAPNLNCRLDHDVFPGNAVADEAITGAGDSGSPLLTGAFGREVSLGVLSQGSRFFYESLGNPNDNFVRFTDFSNYGTTAGWNPLFLFWDQIVVNNPYKYVAPVAGDGEWTDGARWRQEIDPLYFMLTGGALQNALPGMPALGVSSATPNFGVVTPSPSPAATCAFLGTCPPTGGTGLPDEKTPMPGSIALPGSVASPDVVEGPAGPLFAGASPAAAVDGPVASANEAQTTLPWTSGLLAINSGALTGPGSSGFVPNNTNGTAGVQNSTRFFEVSLRAAGTTFVTGAAVTIDRLNVRGSTAGLNIRAGASLATTISSFVDAGTLTVDGAFAPQRLVIAGGLVGGAGTITAPGGVSVSGGTLSPGGAGTVGALAVAGNVVFSGAGLLGIDVASATSNDRLNVSGSLAFGGGFASHFSFAPAAGATWTVATASGGVSGSFSTVASNLVGVLQPQLQVSGSNLNLLIVSLPYTGIDNPDSAAQVASATALDALRGNPGLAPVFAHADLLAPADARQFLEQLAPNDFLAGMQLFRSLQEQMAAGYLDRILAARLGAQGIAFAGALPLARGGARELADPLSGDVVTPAQGGAPGWLFDIKQGFGLFADIRYTEGGTKPSPTFVGADLETWSGQAGLDYRSDEGWMLGGAISAASGDNALKGGLGKTDATSYAAVGYASVFHENVYFDFYGALGRIDIDTKRVAGPFTLRGETDGLVLAGGAAAGFTRTWRWGGWTPEVSINGLTADLAGYTETGGGPALNVPGRDVSSTIGRFGNTVFFDIAMDGDVRLRPKLGAAVAHEFVSKEDAVVGLRFVAAPGTAVAAIPGVERTRSWGELSAGIDLVVADSAAFGLSYEGSVARDDIETQTARGTLRFRW